MLLKYRIIFYAIILCLFGLTLMTVSPVFAEDSAAFIACQEIKSDTFVNKIKAKKNCFRDLARELQAELDAAELTHRKLGLTLN